MKKDNRMNLERAISMAVKYHQGQRDKAEQPYILHPLRVMFRLNTEEEQMVGILHDIVEDTDCTLEELEREGFSGEVIAGVKAMTRREMETYEEFITRLEGNPLARKVKIADMEDNMDVRRLPEIGEKDLKRLQKYRKYWARLTDE